MSFVNVVTLLGGIALFLFGMSIMGDSLKKVAGSKLELILYKLSSTPLKGILLGTGVTAVIQSSSATSVMVVGFVNSGMMKLKQAVGVILGAILGTSVTGWVLCLNSLGGSGATFASYFNTAVLTGLVALAGIIMWMFSKKVSTKNIGGILLGFAVLMYGMSIMSGAIEPLKESAEFIALLTKFTNPFLGILVGLVFTAILQSASAAVGILQALAITGAISFEIAFPIILGIAVGSSVPVMLSALGATINGKRSAFSYLIITVIGSIICGGVFYIVNGFVQFAFMGTIMNMVTIALVNSLFRLITLFILAPCLGLIVKVVTLMFPEKAEDMEEQADMERLEERFLIHPSLALEQSRLVINNMAEKSVKSIHRAVGLFHTYDGKMVKKVLDAEDIVDRYQDKLGVYLTKISKREMTEPQSEQMGEYLHALSDLERISDHARNIAETAEEMAEKKIHFSDAAMEELWVLTDAVEDIVDRTYKAFTDNDPEGAQRIEPLEQLIDELCDEMKIHHINRIGANVCTLDQGFYFNDLLTDFERVSDHCSNIAIAVLESGEKNLYGHEYTHSLKEMKDKAFLMYYNEYAERYKI